MCVESPSESELSVGPDAFSEAELIDCSFQSFIVAASLEILTWMLVFGDEPSDANLSR